MDLATTGRITLVTPECWIWLLLAELLLLLRNVGRYLSVVERHLAFVFPLFFFDPAFVLSSIIPGTEDLVLRILLLLLYMIALLYRPYGRLLYAKRELTYTPCLACPAARTLRAGGREEKHAMLYYSGGFRSALCRSSACVGPDLAPDNAGITARGFRNPRRPESLGITTPCDLDFRAPAFASPPTLTRLWFSTSDVHLLRCPIYSTSHAASTRAEFVAKVQHA